jgi:hypothetical protein
VAEKHQRFRLTKFPPEALRAAKQAFWDAQGVGGEDDTERMKTDRFYIPPSTLRGQLATRRVDVSDEEGWTFDSDDDFFAEYRQDIRRAGFTQNGVFAGSALSITYAYPDTWVSVGLAGLNKREAVVTVFEVLERYRDQARLEIKPTIFIGHGHSPQWRELADYLDTRHGLRIETFESQPREGYTAKEVLERLVSDASFAVLIHTAEDELGDGSSQARPNVIHETGLFQARLGFSRAVIAREAGCESFSNVAGVQEVRFGAGNIREAFGDIIGVIRREFPKA